MISWSAEHGLAFESSSPLGAGMSRVRFLLHGVVFVVDAPATLLTLPGGPVWRLEQPRWFTFDRRVATRLPLKEERRDREARILDQVLKLEVEAALGANAGHAWLPWPLSLGSRQK